jgi:hypothetical protein
MTLRILDVDLLAFERGSTSAREGVVEGVRHSLRTGFVTSTSPALATLRPRTWALTINWRK